MLGNVLGRTALLLGFIWLLAPEVQSQEKYYKMRPAAFWALSMVQAPIDLNHPDYALLEAAVFHATNSARIEKRLKPLAFDPALYQMARQHSAAMAHYDFMDHTNRRQPRFRTMKNRARQARAQVNAENVASSFLYQYPSGKRYFVQGRPEQAGYEFVLVGESLPMPVHSYAGFARNLVNQWMNSPGHRSNILHRDLKRLACGVRFQAGAAIAKQVPMAYSTQNFGM